MLMSTSIIIRFPRNANWRRYTNGASTGFVAEQIADPNPPTGPSTRAESLFR